MKSQINFTEELRKLIQRVPGQIITFTQVVLVIVLLVSFPLLYTVIKNGKFNFSFASLSNGVATVHLTPQTSNLTPNIAQNLDLLFNSNGEYVDGIQLVINFSGEVPSDLGFTAVDVTGLTPIITTIETNADQTKTASIVFITSNPKSPFTTGNSDIKLGSFSLTNSPSGQMLIAFDQDQSTTLRTGTTDDILKNPVNQTYSFALSANSGKLFFTALTPINPQQIGSTFQVLVAADSGTQNLSGVDAQISFDPNVIEVTSIQKSSQTPFISYPELHYDNATGQIFVSANVGTSAQPAVVKGSQIPIAQISAKVKQATSSSSLNFVYTPNDRNDSNLVASLTADGSEPVDILGEVENQPIIVAGATSTNTPSPIPSVSPQLSPTPTSTAIPSPTETILPTPTLQPSATPGTVVLNTIQIGLQGKNRQTADKTAEIDFTIKSLGTNSVTNQTVSTDQNGSANLSLPSGNYEFLIKTPGYLSKAVGSTESPINVDASTPTIDLTSKPLLGGDFNNDGEVNEIDYTLHLLTSFRKSNPVVDLDASGIVNNLDFSIMRGNWGMTDDQLQ